MKPPVICAFKINLCYRDNLFFDAGYFKAFLEEGRRRGHACRAALTLNNAAFREHALPLADSYTKEGDLYLADLWYYLNGPEPNAEPLVIDMLAREIGYYHVSYYMTKEQVIWSFRYRCEVSWRLIAGCTSSLLM